jgi:hypothetical protein
MALGIQVLQDQTIKEEKKKTKSPMSPSSVSQELVLMKPLHQNDYFKDLCNNQRKVYHSVYDIINKIVYDAD